MRLSLIFLFFPFFSFSQKSQSAWIRINQLGYTPQGIKVAVWCSKEGKPMGNWELIDVDTDKTVLSVKEGKPFGAYGPFQGTYRLNFSEYKKPGIYYLKAGAVRSPEFKIANDVYKGAADFCLRYMRQQRTGFNPYLKDSCHTHDGYVLYGEKAGIADSTGIDVVGGWHDASDYLQYSTTSANATYHLMMAYRDFPTVFGDHKLANGLDGKNGMADVMDEAKWGLDWLMKMHPKTNWMFNQIADDRDHMGMRMPAQDTFYGRGFERPVYFVSGETQQRGKFLNNTTGTSSIAGKFASVFALAHDLLNRDSVFRKNAERGTYYDKAMDAYRYGQKKPGVTQTASVRSPYIYAEDNWTDDMELAATAIHSMLNNNKGSNDHGYYLVSAVDFAKKEKITPWLGADTAKHYQWYPFINVGHYELIKQLKTKKNGPVREAGYYKEFVEKFWNNTDTITSYYKEGIQRVWNKARSNAFYRGIPFIWCSNNLTTAFAIQCYWYRELTGDNTFMQLEQANFDWLFGCNPWGTSMVYGLPAKGDTPVDPHSAFTHIKNYPIDGGLVDGPVYTSIYKNLIGIKLYEPDEYAEFQSDLAVYHDDYGDYSTNEPTMDGTASLIYLLAAKEKEARPLDYDRVVFDRGGIIRGDSSAKKIALVFTGDEFADGGEVIANALKKKNVKASFFFTGRFYRNTSFKPIIQRLNNEGHYLGGHSDQHLLYCDWDKRDSLLVTEDQFKSDLMNNYKGMNRAGIPILKAKYFLPPYEWYNDSISKWTDDMGLQLINYTPGTRSHADYTWPELKNYQSSDKILESITSFNESKPTGLNGFILLMHIGTDPRRKDKLYNQLGKLLEYLSGKGYQLVTIDQMLKKP